VSVEDQPVDPAKLDDLARLPNPDGGDMLGVLVAVFLDEEAPACISGMRAAVSTGDTKELARQAHKLRGSAAVFGATRLVQLCEAIERGRSLTSTDVSEVDLEMERVALALRSRCQWTG
jgi:HPt (histidine-containing phosphotransfer) domain-containing protein